MIPVVSEARLKSIFDTLPPFAGQSFADAEFEKIGGLNNRNYRVTAAGKSYVLRVPGEGTEQYIDRKVDEQAGRIAADVGVNAPMVYYDSETGVQLTQFIPDADTMTPERFRDLDLVRRAGVAFATVHNCGKLLMTDFCDEVVAEEYLEILRGKDAWLPAGYTDVQKSARHVREALAARSLPLVPSNNDPVPENFINTKEKMYLLDWEFAGNNDPMWDVGDLSVEAHFGEEQDRALLEAYCGGAYPDHLFSRMILQKSMVFLLWTLWGALQVANKNPLKPSDIHYPFDTFEEYTENRFEKCQLLMSEPDFADHLKIAAT